MSGPLKPVNGQKQAAKPEAPKPQPRQEKIEIGGVLVNPKMIDEKRTFTYQENGKNMNTVFTKAGVTITYPDQTNPDKKPEITILGIRDEWYNPNDSHTIIKDLENATITGNPNKDDYILLEGESANNTVVVDQKEGFFVDKSMRKDSVELGFDTENNTVKMGEDDHLQIWHHQTSVKVDGREVKPPIDHLYIQGEGVSEQEAQLQDALSESQYRTHKHLQKD